SVLGELVAWARGAGKRGHAGPVSQRRRGRSPHLVSRQSRRWLLFHRPRQGALRRSGRLRLHELDASDRRPRSCNDHGNFHSRLSHASRLQLVPPRRRRASRDQSEVIRLLDPERADVRLLTTTASPYIATPADEWFVASSLPEELAMTIAEMKSS